MEMLDTKSKSNVLIVENKSRKPQKELTMKKCNNDTALMTSSTISTISSLSSPIDSGVQLLDSENELTSVTSGLSTLGSESANEEMAIQKILHHPPYDNASAALNVLLDQLGSKLPNSENKTDFPSENIVDKLALLNSESQSYFDKFSNNDTSLHPDATMDEVFEMEHPMKAIANNNNDSINLMNLSLNSYELLDYTIPNTQLTDQVGNLETVDMHVSLSEEVSENLKVNLDSKESTVIPSVEKIEVTENPIIKPQQEEQIVFRRQRKKKSKSDTPKKRVSFHEDILNSTKVDDIHINFGFITHESDDVSVNFLQRGFIKKSDVVKGRYSWAAEGDTPYYEKPHPNRDIKSDIYIHQPRQYPSTSSSSSSTGSVTSSIDEEEDTSSSSSSGTDDNNGIINADLLTNAQQQKLPKSSCLKKNKNKKYINTNIVHEEIKNPVKKKSDTNLLLDANILGSLKNILNFSTSVPLAERGVPEGQEDIPTYSSSHDLSASSINTKRKSLNEIFSADEFPDNKMIVQLPEAIQADPLINDKVNLSKTNLKLTRKEGFYPTYVPNQNLPANIVVCDSNVYEHKGISYSYEYDNFQKTFDKQQRQNKTTQKSLIYKRIFGEFNFFHRNSKDEVEENLEQEAIEEEFEIIHSPSEKSDVITEEMKNNEIQPQLIQNKTKPDKRNTKSYNTSWSDDASSVFDVSEIRTNNSTNNLKHLDSPKRNMNRNNHYTIHSSFKGSFNHLNSDLLLSKSLSSNLVKSTSTLKSSFINRFLANITLRNIIDLKMRKKSVHCMDLYTKKCKIELECNKLIDMEIEHEVLLGKKKQQQQVLKNKWKSKADLIKQLKKHICPNTLNEDEILNIFPIRSCYSTKGETIPLLLVLTSTTLYILRRQNSQQLFTNYFVLPYTDLNAILIAPSAQIIQFSNYKMDMHCMITTGCTNISNDLISYLEIAMRRDRNKPKLLAVKQMDMSEMVQLRNTTCRETSVDKNEEYYYHSIVSIQDSEENLTQAPLGPIKEGPLMYKLYEINEKLLTTANKRWESAYFILKAGVLYLLSSPSQNVPMKIFPLINGACQGACRIANNSNNNDFRPHTFRLIIEDTMLYLAAPNEFDASEWLQELIRVARGMYTSLKENDVIQSCSFLMTSNHLLTVREVFPECKFINAPLNKKGEMERKEPQVLSCAAIIDLIAFRLPSQEQSWCILEFSCREVHEHGGDWIIYFATIAELESFIFILEKLWYYNNDDGGSFPVITIPEDDPINGKCMDIYTSLINILSPNMAHLQIL